MKAIELNKIMKGMHLPNKFTTKGRLAYYTLTHRTTRASVLVGLYLDSSIDPESFIAYYFFQCLYEPFCTLNFSLGDRIGNHWNKDNITKLEKKINDLRIFNNLNTFDDFVRILIKHPYYGEKTGRDSYLALTYFILKEYDKSLFYLDEIISTENDVDEKFRSSEVNNARLIKNSIINFDYNQGITQIIEWQNQTINDIGIKIK